MNHDENTRLIGLLRRVVRDCGKLYGSCAKLMVRRYPTEIEGLPHRFAELMDELHRGLLIKVYVTIVRADDRWSGPEKRIAAAMIEHLWNEKLQGAELREAAKELFHISDKLTWASLVAPFVRYKPLEGSKAHVETIVMRLANLVAKCDGQTMPEEQIALQSLQHEIDSALYPIDPNLAPLKRGSQATAHEKRHGHAGSPNAAAAKGPAAGDGEMESLSEAERERRYQNALSELDELVGLQEVKQQIHSYANFLRLQKERREKGLTTMPLSLHMAFTGNPGTGKTTVARIVGQLLGGMGMLARGHVVETDRSGLVAEYAGQTAPKTNTICDLAQGGVLFIDEAYNLIDSSGDDAYGREAIGILLKRMEDDRETMAVILAGYNEEMRTLIRSNPGLSSRINTKIEFADYQPEEMGEIFEILCEQNEYRLPPESRHRLLVGFQSLYEQRDRHFGNGRLVRNAFEDSVRRLADRVAGVAILTEDLLTSLTPQDIAVSGIRESELERLLLRPHKLRIRCEDCQCQIRLQPENLGQRIRCGKCGHIQMASWASVVER